MNLLLDTQLLLWAAGDDVGPRGRLPAAARDLIDDAENSLLFSVASLWEIAIKHGLGRADFKADPHLLRRGLLENGYGELAIGGDHALTVTTLPHHHKDPFDRILVAQAIVEGVTLLTSDAMLARYPGPIRQV